MGKKREIEDRSKLVFKRRKERNDNESNLGGRLWIPATAEL
jgi:hypothetical protein